MAICAAVLVVDAMWDEIFFSDFPSFQATEHGVMHISRVPSAWEVVLRVVAALGALLGVSIFTARLSATRRTLGGALSSLCVAVVFLVAIYVLQFRPNGFVPNPVSVMAWLLVSFGVGAIGAWLAVRSPNPSLERTREG